MEYLIHLAFKTYKIIVIRTFPLTHTYKICEKQKYLQTLPVLVWGTKATCLEPLVQPHQLFFSILEPTGCIFYHNFIFQLSVILFLNFQKTFVSEMYHLVFNFIKYNCPNTDFVFLLMTLFKLIIFSTSISLVFLFFSFLY